MNTHRLLYLDLNVSYENMQREEACWLACHVRTQYTVIVSQPNIEPSACYARRSPYTPCA